MNSKRIGNLTELQCATALYELGCAISIPFGNSEKYDLIMDYNNVLYKIQCKHAKEIKDENNSVVGICFKTTWQSHNSQGWGVNTYKENEVDFFATFYEGECYLIPRDDSKNFKYLRIIEPRNNQSKRITYLKDYKADKVLAHLQNAHQRSVNSVGRS